MVDEIIYDVVVVGAGPSGSTAAYHTNNLNVLIVDKYDFPRFKLCGGVIDHHELLKTFENYRIIEKELKKYSTKSIHFYWDIKLAFSRSYKHPFNQVNRYEFDNLLLKAALTKDNVSFRKFNVKEIIQKDDYFILSDRDKQIKTKFLIGADGCNSIVLRFLGNKRRRVGEYCLGVEHDIVCRKKTLSNHMFFFYKKEIGYAWVVPTIEGYYLGLGFVGKTKRPIKEYLGEFLQYCLKNNFIPQQYTIRKTSAAPDPVKIARKYATDKIILCGDALGTVKQLTGEGIYYAMLSGKISGKTINLSLENIKKRYKKEIKSVLKRVTFLKNIPSRFIVMTMFTIPLKLLITSKLPKKIKEKYQDWFIEKFLDVTPLQ